MNITAKEVIPNLPATGLSGNHFTTTLEIET
jgi:hypothetical protein